MAEIHVTIKKEVGRKGKCKMKKWITICLLFFFVFSLSGCRADEEAVDNSKAISVGLVTESSGIEEDSISRRIWDALQNLQHVYSALEISYQQPDKTSSYEVCIQQLALKDCSLILCADGTMKDVIEKIAKNYPELQFAIFNCDSTTQSNVTGLMFSREEAVYLAGIAAGKSTQSERVGCIHGRLTTQTEKLLVSFMAGVKAANRNVEILRTNSLIHKDGGALAAEEMITHGVDVIFHVDGDQNSAVLQQCQKNGIWAIGVNWDSENMKQTLASASDRVEVVVANVVQKAMDKTLQGEVLQYGLQNDGVVLSAADGVLTDSAANTVHNAKNKLLAGEVTLPSSLEELTE